MDKLKKLNGSMIAAIVLSVLLIMSITTGATLAWFASRDSAKNSLVMGEAVVVTIGEDYKQGDGELAMNLPVDRATGGLLPGMSVTPNVKVQLQQSNTNALLRARFITSVEYPDLYEDAAFTDQLKYPNADGIDSVEKQNTHQGRVLTTKARVVYKSADGKLPQKDGKDDIEEAKKGTGYKADGTAYRDSYGDFLYIDAPGTAVEDYKYQVFAGYMIYDYYNYLGHRLASDMTTEITKEQSDAESTTEPFSTANLAATKAAHTKVIHLNRVKVRDDIAKQIGTGNTVTVNGVPIPVTAENAAELEIRQRGVDLTNAINRVLQGQRGYRLGNDGVLRDDASGLKYSRRVADGWAYRDADQAWYYLGSATNGFVLENQGGVNEAVTTTTVAQDITAYNDVKLGNVTVKQPTYTDIAKEDGKPNDMRRNYLGGTSDDAFIDRISNETGVLKQKTISSVNLGKGNVSIDFLTKRFILPSFIDNSYAKAKVTFTFTVEAVQDYLVDPLQEATAAADRLPNNLVNAILVFNNAFPQMLFPQTDNPLDKLRATGSSVNVIPGGGESVTWSTTGTDAGKTKLVYNDAIGEKVDSDITSVKIETDEHGVKYINAATDVIGAEGNQYSYGHLKEKTITDSGIKGFDIKVDEYGDTVADYTKGGVAWIRGTASSLGVCPFWKETTPAPGP